MKKGVNNGVLLARGGEWFSGVKEDLEVRTNWSLLRSL